MPAGIISGRRYRLGYVRVARAGASNAYTADLRNKVAMQMEAYKTIISRLRPFKGAKVVIALSGGVATMSDPTMVPRQL